MFVSMKGKSHCLFTHLQKNQKQIKIIDGPYIYSYHSYITDFLMPYGHWVWL